jgi:2-keto-4-pentenoate hydratase/2-oxohepta-3-ene-1,7-dioic acid hydratase in catechol pathway
MTARTRESARRQPISERWRYRCSRADLVGNAVAQRAEFGDGDFEKLHLTTHVNGELRQDDTPATMAYPIEFQIEYLSTFCTLEPGDIIFTGTPTGAGARFDPPRFLEPGDVVEVSVPELGTLRNGIADENVS